MQLLGRNSTAAKRHKAMQPSMSVLEPGLERGVPWGRDLYTFVTSAAGHMMRTLQKPRKSRPSKRQVNHRRFLHNMIQRKFADIEAANHRLASAIYSKEGENNPSSVLSQKQQTPGDPFHSDSVGNSEKYSIQKDTEGILNSRNDADSYETDSGEKKQSDPTHHWKSHHKPPCTTRMNDQCKGSQRKEMTHKLSEFSLLNSSKDKNYFQEAELFHSEYFCDQSHLKPTINLTDDSQAPPNNSSEILFTQNENNSPSFSSDFSPLSFDSCDFSVKMFSSCSEAQKKSITDVQLADLYSVGNFYSEGCMDIQDYFESICSYQDDAKLEVCANDFVVGGPSDHFTGVEGVCSGGGEYKYGVSCQESQEETANYFQDDQRSSRILTQSQYTDEKQLNNLSQSTDMNQNLLPTSTSCSYNTTQLQTHQRLQDGSPCILLNNINLTPFEGVAQSFCASPPHHTHRLIPTPPQEEDWLFTDILKDRQSPYY